MDCIYCDRCRWQVRSSRQDVSAGYLQAVLTRCLLLSVLIVAIFVSAAYINRFTDTIPSPGQYSLSTLTSTPQSYGRPQEVDIQKIRTMIEEKKLSDHEAQFYRKVD